MQPQTLLGQLLQQPWREAGAAQGTGLAGRGEGNVVQGFIGELGAERPRRRFQDSVHIVMGFVLQNLGRRRQLRGLCCQSLVLARGGGEELPRW